MPEYCMQQLQKNTYRTLIKTMDNKPIFLLVGKIGIRGSGFTLYHINGDVAAQAKQTSFAFASHFDLYNQFEKVGSIQRLFPINKDIYYIHKLKWLVSGDLYNQTYTIRHFHHTLMTMELGITPDGNSGILDISNEQDAPLCICIVAIMNYWLWNNAKKRKKTQATYTEKDILLS